jgi:kynurenine formamidase
MKIIDLTQTITHQMQVYPGDEAPTLVQTRSLEQDNFTNFRLSTGMHAGTHIDGPWHMVGEQRFIGDMPLETYIGKGCIFDIRQHVEFDDSDLVRKNAAGCTMAMFYTGYGAKFNTGAYAANFPLVSNAVAQTLVEMGIKFFGIDTFGPDQSPHTTHHTLLKNGVAIAENLTNLDLLLPHKDFDIVALPLKIKADSAPARIIALVHD